MTKNSLTEEQLLQKIDSYHGLTKEIENKLISLNLEIKEFENIIFPFLINQIDTSVTLTDTLVTYLSIFYSNACYLLDNIWFLDSGYVDNDYKATLAESHEEIRKQIVSGKTISQTILCYYVADETYKKMIALVRNNTLVRINTT